MNKLTIAIPTYNRKERLKQQLTSILSQPCSEKVDVLICDNNSSYDVNEMVTSNFGGRSNIKVVSNKYNVGADANIAMTFLRCQTQWMWLLGDDDETTNGSIETILSDIEEHSDQAYFKYSITGFKPYEDNIISTLEDFIDVYHNGNYLGGDLIFISNNVYNLSVLGDYYRTTLSYSFCRVSQLIPVFNYLNEKRGCVMLRSFPIVTYKRPEKGSAWNMLSVAVGISSLRFVSYDIDSKHYVRLMDKVGSGFPHGQIARECLRMENRKQSIILYHHVYNALFKHRRTIHDWYIYLVFHVIYFLGIRSNKI